MVEANQTIAVEQEFGDLKNTFDDEFAQEDVQGPARAATTVTVTTVTVTTVTVTAD
jgi:hypothetical protein